MKYFLTITLTLFAFILVAQSGTTLDEYRYLAKGYAYQLEMGLDPVKKGYEIRKNHSTNNKTNIVGLYQLSDQQLKGLLLVVKDEDERPYYWVVPNPQSDIKVRQMYEQDLLKHQHKKIHSKMLQAKDEYLFALSTHLLKNDPFIPTTNNEYSQKSLSQPSVATKTQSYNSPPRREPTTYDALPPAKKEKFTTKGGTSLLAKGSTTEAEIQPTYASKSIRSSNLKESTVTGQINQELATRTLILPFTQNTTSAKGKVIIKFCTNAEGVVTFAKFTQRGSTTLNPQLKTLALAAVRKMRLAPSGRQEDCGTVGFSF